MISNILKLDGAGKAVDHTRRDHEDLTHSSNDGMHFGLANDDSHWRLWKCLAFGMIYLCISGLLYIGRDDTPSMHALVL